MRKSIAASVGMVLALGLTTEANHAVVDRLSGPRSRDPRRILMGPVLGHRARHVQARRIVQDRWVNTAEVPGNGIDDDVNGYDSSEGSYGRTSSGTERPEATGVGACDLPRNLEECNLASP